MKMKVKIFLGVLLLISFTTLSSAVIINEFVTDPKTDWNQNGNVTNDKDEWFELYNPASESVNLSGWTLNLVDGTNVVASLDGIIPSNGYLIISDPSGQQNNDGQIFLLDPHSNIIDSVTYGDWDDENISDNAPDGNADSIDNECLARIPNGQDTNIDNADWQKVKCTFGTENGVIPQNEQSLNVTITGKIVFQISPRTLEFGIVQPNSINNPALNGPIILNFTGSTANAQIEVTEVNGEPFHTGLKIDGSPALNSAWIIQFIDPIKQVFPTLDIPSEETPGNRHGTIVYTISGTP